MNQEQTVNALTLQIMNCNKIRIRFKFEFYKIDNMYGTVYNGVEMKILLKILIHQIETFKLQHKWMLIISPANQIGQRCVFMSPW